MIRPTVSVIVPTYNRKNSLLRTLDSLSRQTYAQDDFEVVVVDDGGSDDLQDTLDHVKTISLRYISQPHLGGTAAKNRGADESRGELLVFLDDDITIVPPFLDRLVSEHKKRQRTIVVGTLHSVPPSDHWEQIGNAHEQFDKHDCVIVPFTECLGGFFSIRREDFFSLGMLQDPTPGLWPNWEDVDLAYRAHREGFVFCRCTDAIGFHWDHVLVDLPTQCARWERASYAAVFLFQKYPNLVPLIPMFLDKVPIDWRQDRPTLILRKLARQTASLRSVVYMMKYWAAVLETRAPTSTWLPLLNRWIISGHIYSGYREGLREHSRSRI